MARAFLRLALLAVGLAGAARILAQQPPLNVRAPLVAPDGGISPGSSATRLTAAQRAQDLGMSSIAAGLYRQLLDDLRGATSAEAAAERARLTLALASSLLEAGRAEEAQKALHEIPEPRDARWHLRAGLAAAQLRQPEAVRAAVQAIKSLPDLPPEDHAWFWFLEGAMIDLTAPLDSGKANEAYARAENAATNALARARFQLAAEELRIRRGTTPPRADDVRVARQNFERLQGTDIGYRFAQQVALMYMGLDQQDDALVFLQQVVPGIPAAERRWWDDLRLTLGVIGDRGRTFAARRALSELLEHGHDPKRQRQALQLLWEASPAEPARGQLRALLDRLLGAAVSHPIEESLRFYRAQLALAEKNHAQASAHANALLEQFPGSELRAHVHGLLTELAWEQQRYRLAADQARKARAELAESTRPEDVAARAELGVLEAEAYFRAGDFRNAADAYAATLREPPANVKPGDLMFQRVLAEIRAGSADAVSVLDELARRADFDPENRWEAEWSLARAALARGEVAAAFARVNALIEEPARGAVSAGLRARMEWLRARLALEARQPEQALALIERLLQALDTVEPSLRDEIASTALLQRARAQFELQRERDAVATLAKVREEFPKSEAAIQSFLIEADFHADQGQVVKAQQVLTSLTDDPTYRGSVFIPYAYYQLALWSEKLGQPKDLEDANRYLENSISSATASNLNDLVFEARMKQGNIFRKRNDFPSAQRAYEDAARKPVSDENLILARLELARTHYAQATNDPARAEQAQLLFEELRDRVDARPDVRVEAGYHLGLLLQSRGREDQAARVWWQDVITPFLLESEIPFEGGAKRPYWLARTLLDLGALLEAQGRHDEARNAYDLLRRKNLGWGQELALKALERLGVPAEKL